MSQLPKIHVQVHDAAVKLTGAIETSFPLDEEGTWVAFSDGTIIAVFPGGKSWKIERVAIGTCGYYHEAGLNRDNIVLEGKIAWAAEVGAVAKAE